MIKNLQFSVANTPLVQLLDVRRNMRTFRRYVLITIFVSAFLASGQLRAEVQEPAERNIPVRLISDLQDELLATEDIASTTQRRRICKNIVRSASSHIKRYPDSPNRFEVLGIVFENQKALLTRGAR